MAIVILTQVRDALRALMDAGSTAFGDGMEEDGDASRQLALLQSLALMVGKMADPIEEDGPLSHWTRQLLQMLEDGTPSVEVEEDARTQFYKAIGSMQALLQVPEEGRAWVEPAQEDALPPLRVQDAQGWAKQAQSLVPIFLSVLSAAEVPEPEGVCMRALAERLGATLGTAQTAPTTETYAECIESASDLLAALSGHMQSAPDALWGLLRGMNASLDDATPEAEDNSGAANAETLAEGGGQRLTELRGDLGERAQIIRECACEIMETAETLIDRIRATDPQELSRPYRHMLARLKALSGITLSAVDDDLAAASDLREAMA